MSIQSIEIARIETTERLRLLRDVWVETMVAEIATGQPLPPIEVAETEIGYRLVAGAHRLAAAKKAGAATIEARVWPLRQGPQDEAWLRLREIKENIVRYELTELDRAVAILAWKEIYEGSQPLPKRGPKPKKAATPELIAESAKNFVVRFSAAAAEAMDISERSVQVSIQIASGLAADTRQRLSATPLANRQSELLQLSHQSAERQSLILDLLLAEEPEAHSVAEAIAVLDKVPPPLRITGWERVSDRFSRLQPPEQFRFFDAHAEAIEMWVAARKAASKPTRRSA
jgi:ParB family chromosome partitioning protein